MERLDLQEEFTSKWCYNTNVYLGSYLCQELGDHVLLGVLVLDLSDVFHVEVTIVLMEIDAS